MAKKVLYLGNNKWCWTENCTTHSAIIIDKNNYLAAKASGSTEAIAVARQKLIATDQGFSTYRYLQTKELRTKLGRKPTIGLDLDNTIADFTHGMRERAGLKKKISQAEWLTHFPEPVEYSMWMGDTSWYLDKDDFVNELKAAELAGIYKTIAMYPNANTVLKELKAYGFDIKAVTARGAEFNDDTRSWIVEHSIPTKVILNPGFEKHNVPGIDVYIDDAPHVIDKLIQNNKKVIIMNQTYNETAVVPHENSRRAANWNDKNKIVNDIFELIDEEQKTLRKYYHL
jgi:uncharacterized HAD superfamily protein